METGSVIGFVVVIFIILCFIISKQDDKIREMKFQLKNAKLTIENQKMDVQTLKESNKFYCNEAQKTEHKLQAIEEDYDRLLKDYNRLKGEKAG